MGRERLGEMRWRNIKSVDFNGLQLSNMKKFIPRMSLPWNLSGGSGWSKKFQLCFKNYDFSEYVKFGAISLKNDIL